MSHRAFSWGYAAVAGVVLTLFATVASAATVKVLYSFGTNAKDGYGPQSALILDREGNLYGTVTYGGAHDCGTVFELERGGGELWTEKVLDELSPSGACIPYAGLIFDPSGNLYGTSITGGSFSAGTVYKLAPAGGGTWTETVVHSFGGNPDGNLPVSGVILDAAGNLYGTTSESGTKGGGTVFEVDTSDQETVLTAFKGSSDLGSFPTGGLILDSAGNLYGTTELGGTAGEGIVFELTPLGDGVWKNTQSHSFDGINGAAPTASLVADEAGNLYGTTANGGQFFGGTVFELTPKEGGGWSEKILHNFLASPKGGEHVSGGVIFDGNGNLYGTTSKGGAHGRGEVFELSPTAQGNWEDKVVHSFAGEGTDGANPLGSLVLDAAGHLFGTTSEGGAYHAGTIFEVIP